MSSNNKVIWIVNHYAQKPNNFGGTRHYCLSKYLKEKGWEPYIIASSREYHTNRSHINLSFIAKATKYNDVNFLFLHSFAGNGRMITRLINMLYFSVLLPFSMFFLPKPKVIIGSTVHPFAAFTSWLISISYQIPFVFEVRDLWPETLVQMKAIKKGSLIFNILHFIEVTLYKNQNL